MKTVVIMQPTFLPWIGYFDLIDQSDTFVFLENVQFEKQSWQQRNRIVGPAGLEWITVPIFTKGRFGQKIADVEIKNSDFPAKQLRTIRHHYSRAPYFKNYWQDLEEALLSVDAAPSLAALNIRLIRWLALCFGISADFVLASELEPKGDRSERLVSIIGALGAQTYLSPAGAAAYLQEDRNLFSGAGIDILFQNYSYPEYRQSYPGFVSGASAIDILFNEGPEAGRIIRSGRRAARKFDEVCDDRTSIT